MNYIIDVWVALIALELVFFSLVFIFDGRRREKKKKARYEQFLESYFVHHCQFDLN